jgi:hypothetical protein
VGGISFKSKKIKNKTGWGMGVGSITYLLEFGRVFIALAKPRRQALPASFCDNIVNHERKDFKKKYLLHAHYMMLDILI